MTSSPKMILIEFNELTPCLMDKFRLHGQLPNFQRFYDESHIYVTDAEESGESLNPWVQWVSLHTGMSAKEHGVFRLSDGGDSTIQRVWDLLSEAGFRVWVCGSMNARYGENLNGFLLPDPWSVGATPHPPSEFAPYYEFVRDAVQEHTNVNYHSPAMKALRFLFYMAFHGISLNTLGSAVAQLGRERTGDFHWKRAVVLDQFQLDVFSHYFRKHNPHFSTFFLNSTAHYQHHFWRFMEPEHFAGTTAGPADQSKEGAVLLGYQNMDRILGKLMAMAGSDTTLVFCTALSQQPYVAHEDSKGRHFYRIKHENIFAESLGLTDPFEYQPIMAEQCRLKFDSVKVAERAYDLLTSYRVLDERVFNPSHNQVFHAVLEGDIVNAQCRCTTVVPSGTVIESDVTARKIPFSEVFYHLDDTKSGYHHPDGMLWVRHPKKKHAVHEQKVSIRAISPAILNFFGVCERKHMDCEPFAYIKPDEYRVNCPSLV